MKYTKNINFLMISILLLQVGIGFAYNQDRAAEGEAILKNLKRFAEIPTPNLIEAVKKGNLEDVKSALNSPETNVNALDKYGETALMHAVESGRTDLVKLLIDKGADPHIIAWNDNTALREAVKGGHKEIIKLLLLIDSKFRKDSMSCALVEAAQKGDKDSVHLLLDNGADLNVAAIVKAPDSPPSSNTALIVAASEGHKDIVRLLLDKGANINATTSTSNATALLVASSKGHKDIVKLLLDKGADPHIRHVWGKTALEIAKSKGHKEIVQLIESAINEK